jgi:hypothetical protein
MKQEEAQQHNERLVAPPEEEQQPQPGAPLAQSLSCGVSTFLAAGVVDLVGHLGLTGLVVGGIAAYAASQHGPQLLEQVRGALPTRPSHPQGEAPRTLASESGNGKRSLLDRALGRFPARGENGLEDVETVVVEEPRETPRASSRSFRPSVTAQVVRHPICLAPDLVLEANDIVGAGINIFGVKGSGKTGAVARLAEQFAPLRVSEVLFDLKGDLDSLVTDRRRDGRPYVPNGYLGTRERAPRGRTILKKGVQAVYDLRTWQTPEEMANLICVIVEEMLETVALTPEGDLAPCLVFLDEAEYWLPQSQPSYLSGHTYRRLLDAFHLLATMGRSRGLAPVIATQRIAKVNKDIIAQAEMNVLMKAVLDIDLDRYSDYFNKSLASRERIRGFEAGEAVVCLPDGSQVLTRFFERESRHRSHTPHVTAALTKFTSRERGPLQVERDEDSTAAGYVPSADQSIRRVTTPPQAAQGVSEDMRPDRPPVEPAIVNSPEQPQPRMGRVDLHKNKVLLLALQYYQAGAKGPRPLARAMGVSVSTAKSYIDRLEAMGEL